MESAVLSGWSPGTLLRIFIESDHQEREASRMWGRTCRGESLIRGPSIRFRDFAEVVVQLGGGASQRLSVCRHIMRNQQDVESLS